MQTHDKPQSRDKRSFWQGLRETLSLGPLLSAATGSALRGREDPSRPLQQRAESIAATMPPLLTAAERVAATVAQGVHGRRRVGQGDAFWQFRTFQPGDTSRAIDWRRSARSDTLFVRETEWEAAQSVWLWRDGSGSMAYRSRPDLPEKGDRAALLLLALASLLTRAGEHVALAESDMIPGTGRAVLERLAQRLQGPSPADSSLHKDQDAGGETDADRAGEEAEESENQRDPSQGALPEFGTMPRHAALVWISDFLGEPEAIAERMTLLAARGIHGHLVQLLDPAEESLPFEGRIRFEGLEGEGALLVPQVGSLREAYQRRLLALRAALRDEAQRLGWTFTLHHTDQPAEAALLGLYAALSGEPLQRPEPAFRDLPAPSAAPVSPAFPVSPVSPASPTSPISPASPSRTARSAAAAPSGGAHPPAGENA